MAMAIEDSPDFERNIRPLMKRHCGKCHGVDTQKSGLRLDAREPAFRGGDSGPVIVPGKSRESEILRRIRSDVPEERMPPEGPRLTENEIQLLERWIDTGAIWPETAYDRENAKDRRLDHWAWQPLQRVIPPQLSPESEAGVLNDVDRFVLHKLNEHQLTLSPEADRRTLIRRLSFDLHGLPPSPEEVSQFVSDPDPHAVERLVDRLLASGHYGERWARHWLDIAHYADTHGFERDQRRDHAFHYRDWVIRALNRDMPYDQFLRDQIAGDVLRPEDADAVAATGFLAAGPWDFVGQAETPSPVLKRLARADDLDDMITQVMTATCGVTINCARCHDHKLDPVSQREYYALAAVFAGVKRGDRVLSVKAQRDVELQKSQLEEELKKARSELASLKGSGWSLADIVSGGNGQSSGRFGAGIDPTSGRITDLKRGFLEGAPVNRYVRSDVQFVDGVSIPDGESTGRVPVSSTGLIAEGIPDTSGQAWDAIRNGPVNSPFSTVLDGIDFVKDEHSLLSLHANAAITFDLSALRSAGLPETMRLSAQAGYFGQTPAGGASFHVFLDGKLCTERRGIGRGDGLTDLDIEIPGTARFLTLMATDHSNGIGHDQICFADAMLLPLSEDRKSDDDERIAELKRKIQAVRRQLEELPAPAKVYAINAETPAEIHVQLRGDPEQAGEVVGPGTISCLPLSGSFGTGTMSDAERRIALADWMTSPDNPLTARVIVNRLWHHHFGAGLVETPSDFGLGGSLPSHPELLDWLAGQLQSGGWSQKSVHRLICLSAAYRQASAVPSSFGADERSNTGEQNDGANGTDADGMNAWQRAQSLDAANRMLWRQNPRRLDAESLRDAVLTVSGKLDKQMYGPGYRDFEYREEYAPVYTYVAADRPEVWRRTIYRFVVRTSPDPFLTTLDCPNAANLTPARSMTTTALQSLALLNNEFMLQQAQHFAVRLEAVPGATAGQKIEQAFQLAFGRSPTAAESEAAGQFVKSAGMVQFCRAILNANEFVYVD